MDELRLTDWLRQASGQPHLVIRQRWLLAGGAIQQNWALDVSWPGGEAAWVLRTDSAAVLDVSLPRAAEYALLRVAFAAGVTVPEPLFLCEDLSVTGAPFFVMRRVAGITAGHRLVKSDTAGGGRHALVRRLGEELARIHAIRPPRPELPFLGAPPEDAGLAFIAASRAALDRQREPRPVLEWGLRHLELTAPAPLPAVLCHNDFRTGNLMVTEAGLTAVLDWEFAAWGDPHADLGWLCAPCWRFGNFLREAGGIGDRAELYAAYEAASGTRAEPARVRWWELAATIRWALIAIDQAERHISGTERSLELALTGHLVPGLEWEVLDMVEAANA
ncbi:aminoglycoside phosphotransferase (APT) family kinase protein [Humitalea rosea]|uniref:Aminoglycoside phosphotransferase (APT) family kinase protein n=1 Tax=Humitalea rosea TaxID=990373 RepID=A0A2W7IJD4_9PROT|nr:phosphotransferase family protein [Humitalea rosea]PZW46808.1 aminoglycoside phosphotransferase (APT) family kinase protein [Humitalea rosea]